MDKIGDDISGFFTGLFASNSKPNQKKDLDNKSREMYPHFPHKDHMFTGIYTITFDTGEEGELGFEIDMGNETKTSDKKEGQSSSENQGISAPLEEVTGSSSNNGNGIESNNVEVNIVEKKRSQEVKVIVKSVTQGSLAYHKGIQIGDMISKIDGNEVQNIEAFLAVMEGMGNVRPITIELERIQPVSVFKLSENSMIQTQKDSSKESNAFENMNNFFSGITNIIPQQKRSQTGGQLSKQVSQSSLDIPPEERRAMLLKAAENRNKAWDNKLQKNREIKAQKAKENKEKLNKDLAKLEASQKEHMKNRLTEVAVNNAKAHEGFTASKLGYNPYEAQIRGNSANATSSNNNEEMPSLNINDSSGSITKERRISSSSLQSASSLILNNDQTLIAKVHDELEIVLSILEQHDKAVKAKLLTVLAKILSNILKDPENEKYLTIRLANPNIHDAIVSVDGGMELMNLCGFDIETMTIDGATKDTGQFFCFRLEESIDTSENVRKLSKINIVNKKINDLMTSNEHTIQN